MIKEIKLIYSDEERCGKGIEGDPVRCTYKLVSHDGKLILYYDPETEETQVQLNNLNDILNHPTL